MAGRAVVLLSEICLGVKKVYQSEDEQEFADQQEMGNAPFFHFELMYHRFQEKSTHRREYVRWIEEAKAEQTRCQHIGRTLEMLKQGKKGR